MDLGPYEGIPGVTAPFVRVSTHGSSGYYLDVDVGVTPSSSSEKPPEVPLAPLPRTPKPAPPDTHAVFNRGIRHHQSTLEPFTYTALNTIQEEMGVVTQNKKFVRKRSASGEGRSDVTSGCEEPSSSKLTSRHQGFYKRFDDKPIKRSSSFEMEETVGGDVRPRGRLLPAPHVNPNRDLPRDPTAPKPPPFPVKLAKFTKDRVVPASKTFANEKVVPAAKATKTFTKEKVIPGVKTGAERTIYHTRKGAKIAQYKTHKGARLTKKKAVQFFEATKPKVKRGAKKTGKKVKQFIRSIKMRRRGSDPEYPWLDYRDYCMSPVEVEEPEEILESEGEEEFIEEVIDLQIPEFQPRPGQASRDFKSPYLDQVMRKGDAIPTPVSGMIKDDMSLSRRKSPPVSGLTSPVSILSSPASIHRDVMSLNTSEMQDACTIDKLKQEIQRLQKTLSDKEDLVLATRRIAADKERKLKGELAEVTEKYGEVCQEKVSLEDEIILLKDTSVNKEEHNKHAKQLAEGHQLTKKEVTDRDEKLKLLKEQITSALDEKSIARQEQLKELSRELEHTAQENRMLHKKIQELSHKIQNCDNCAKLKSQLKLIQDGNGKRLVDVNILKPIKDSTKPDIEIPLTKEVEKEDVYPPKENVEAHSPTIDEQSRKNEETASSLVKKYPEEKALNPVEVEPKSQVTGTVIPGLVPPPPPPPPIGDILTSNPHDYDTLSPVNKDTDDVKPTESTLKRQESSRTRRESGADDEDFVDAAENFPEAQTYSPVDEERKAGLEASLEDLRQPTRIDGSPKPAVAEGETAESPTSTIVNKTTEDATLKLIGEYEDRDKLVHHKKSPEVTKSMFDKIREFFEESEEVEPENYAPISITTSKCSVCQGLHKSGSSGSSPHDHDFSIYGPLTLDGSPDSTGSFCPICQSRAEHDLAVKTDTHG